MDIDVSGGTYIVAVSGGVDSIALLDLLTKKPDLKLIVAHFDHGIRQDSTKDRRLVQRLAKDYGLTFVYDEGNLGSDASEAVAREARYKFLHRVCEVANAKSIITAHHQDDLVETAIINMIRGTGRRGLTSLSSTQKLCRPLLGLSKEALIKYAKEKNLTWREDSSNQDTKYMRNHIRHKVTPKMTTKQRQQLLDNILKIKKTNSEIDNHIGAYLDTQTASNKLDRDSLIMLPHNISKEVMHSWLRSHHVENIDKKQVDKLVIIAKTSQPNRTASIDKFRSLQITEKELFISNH